LFFPDKNKNKWDLVQGANFENDLWEVVTERHLTGILAYLFNGKSKIEKLTDRLPIIRVLPSASVQLAAERPIHADTMFERRKAGEQATNPSMVLSNHSWDDAAPFLRELRSELVAFTGEKSLAGVNHYFQNAKSEQRRRVKELETKAEDAEDEQTKVKWINNLISELAVDASFERNLQAMNSPKGLEIKTKIEAYLSYLREELTAIQGGSVTRKFEAGKVRAFYDFLNSLSSFDRLNRCSSSMVSTLTTPEQTKVWLSKESHTLTRGAPKYLLKVAFNLSFRTELAEDDNALANGPGMAYWGEGGFGILEVDNDYLPGTRNRIVLGRSQVEEALYGKARSKSAGTAAAKPFAGSGEGGTGDCRPVKPERKRSAS